VQPGITPGKDTRNPEFETPGRKDARKLQAKEKPDRQVSELLVVAIEDYRVVGPGLVESVHEHARGVELGPKNVIIDGSSGRGRAQGSWRRPGHDLLLSDRVLLEIKAVRPCHR
jgi:hypothetical protein